jgi:hypothetical protein
MTKVFNAWRLIETVRGVDPKTGEMTEMGKNSFFVVDEATETYIREKTGRNSFFLMNVTSDPATWAVVFFTTIIERTDEVLKVRDELNAQIRFVAEGEPKPGMKYPPFGTMLVNRPEELAAASSRHEVFQKAWDALKACAPDKEWVAVIDL